MRIGQKLLVIVVLTIIEVSITVWAAFQISKGATFHQLNFLHLKYNNQFMSQVVALENGIETNFELLVSTVNKIRQQPIDCLKQVGWLDKFIMQLIDTDHALDLCQKDIQDADEALLVLEKYKNNEINKQELIQSLRHLSQVFIHNSTAFEGPVTFTVEFILRTMIPMIIVISILNISFITYLSRTISGSIRQTINLLSKKSEYSLLSQELQRRVSGELKELLDVARDRIEKDCMNIEMNEKLQQLVFEKTTSLKQANEELEQFSYRTSHDLKGPLTRTKRLCRFVIDDIRDNKHEQAIEHLKFIEQQMASLEKLVEDLMSLSKADLNEHPKEKIDLQALIDELLQQQKIVLEESGLEVQIDFAACKTVVCQGERLIQVLENLLSNSCKYRDQNKQQSWLKIVSNIDDSHYYLSIEDNGLGIPEAYREGVFKQFKRFHPDVSFGSGLGLSIIKKHIEKMQGSIEYQPKPEGTAFKIKLPISSTENKVEAV
ncbi:MAG: HAMP domain-containing sensor histidine kinase [Pseudomonadota bacterium]